MRVDPYNSKRTYERWMQQHQAGIPGLSPENSSAITQFLVDMERGANIAKGSRKGGRSHVRLNTLRTRLVFLARLFEQRLGVSSLAQLSEDHLHRLFRDMRSGELVRRDGHEYRSTGDYVKAFKTFWHWHMRVQRRRGETVTDICGDLDDSRAKAPWVYLTEEDVRALCRHARFDHRALILFLFDSGIRSPTELLNVRIDDLSDECGTLRIRQETSKTFGRTIRLLLSQSVLREYVRERHLSGADCLFSFTPSVMNRYLRRLATRVLGDAQTAGGSKYSELTLYDFRHASACYWLPRYKSESALKYRFGWKRTDMVHYYTELLGMRDTVTRDDLLLGDEKTEIDQQLARTRAEKHLLEEELETMRNDMRAILRTVESLSRIVVAAETPPTASDDRGAKPSLP